ncbi:MAG: CbiQ family ECF transporter T component [bacterium]
MRSRDKGYDHPSKGMKEESDRIVLSKGHTQAARVVATVLLVCVAAWLPRGELEWQGAAAGGAAVWLALQQVSWRRLMWNLAALLPVSAGMAVFALFGADGWRLFGVLLLKGVICLALVCGLMQKVSFTELLALLARARLPGPLLTTLALLERYRFVLQDESHRLLLARRCRLLTAEPPGWSVRAAVLGRLFTRSSDRAERIYRAMEARGWRS